ncbi:WxL protein peptidoglycan domain-containing protein [Herbidospora sp. RD11066]
MIRKTLAVLAAALMTVPLWPAAAMAEPEKDTLTWSVQPATAAGPDGRRWIELSLDPGATVTEHLAVRNFSDGAATFSLKAADGYLTDKGRFNMLQSNQTSKDGGTWIDVQNEIKVGPNETKVVPFTITVPRNATPGDHPAGIAAAVHSANGTVAVESRVGFRVMMRATGDIKAAVAVSGLSASYDQTWNPFTSGTVTVKYTATNEGNVAASGAGAVAVSDLTGLAERDGKADVAEIFPGDSRTVETKINGVWALGPMSANVTVTPSVEGGSPMSAAVTVWTVPWPQLALIALLVVLFFAYRAITKRRRRHLENMLARARDEGRAQASGV